MSRRILVTGATGETGRYATDLLISQGFEIRALVHKVDERSEKLRARGAEVIVGDLLDFEAVRHATRGVDAAYFVYPIRPGLIDATAYFAQASKEAALNGVVNMSQLSAREDSKSHAARDHWIASACLIGQEFRQSTYARRFSRSGSPIPTTASTYWNAA